jgi:hypothetical protein
MAESRSGAWHSHSWLCSRIFKTPSASPRGVYFQSGRNGNAQINLGSLTGFDPGYPGGRTNAAIGAAFVYRISQEHVSE